MGSHNGGKHQFAVVGSSRRHVHVGGKGGVGVFVVEGPAG